MIDIVFYITAVRNIERKHGALRFHGAKPLDRHSFYRSERVQSTNMAPRNLT